MRQHCYDEVWRAGVKNKIIKRFTGHNYLLWMTCNHVTKVFLLKFTEIIVQYAKIVYNKNIWGCIWFRHYHRSINSE